MKIISVVGARPQFIKLAPLSKEIRKYHEELIIHTGQHFDQNMSDLFFQELELPKPDYHFGVSTGSHAEQTATILVETEKCLIKEKPDLVIVFGDTNTTLAASLAAIKLNINTIHVEAGLRSYNKTMPEEINRITSDHICNHLFAPTETAIKNLSKEGLGKKAFLTGDIMVDSLNMVFKKAVKKSSIIKDLNLMNKKYYLLTLHRPYNVDNSEKIFFLLNKLSNLEEIVVFPIHPRTRKVLSMVNQNFKTNYNKIIFTEPLGYLDFIVLQSNSHKIITDSGGIQKEAYILKKPCITVRPETEWVETLESGWNILLDSYDEELIEKIITFQQPNSYYNLFGEKVSLKMTQIINNL